ncbi:MAG: hypothetical protein SV765_18060 [Pseudomonadota bacterium]|nr:hypothetical protein [Pseudomonadota bacterium]
MSKQRLGLLVFSLLWLSACGGNDSNDNDAPEPFVDFRINGVPYPDEVVVRREHITAEDLDSSGDPQWNPCNPELYANAQELLDSSDPDIQAFCANEISSTTVSFTVQYVNATYDDLAVDYTGQGYSIRIYEYDEVSETLGRLVWSSAYYTQYVVERARDSNGATEEELPDYDANAANSTVLGPSEAIPSQDLGASQAVFFGDKNIVGDPFAPPAYATENLLQNPPGDDICDWGQVATESGDVPYQHVLCRTEMLLPLPSEDQAVIDAGGEPEEQVFLARIEFNFNGWSQQPDDVIVRIQPPAQ